MLQKIRKQTKGFTIIEVLIVLAIAGLILLIVFLAVPALQRNSRNNGRRNDIGRIGAGVSEYASNNNGQLPANALLFGSIVTSIGNFAQFTDPVNEALYATGAQAVIGNDPARPRYRLVVGAKCDTTGGGTVAASNRQAALQYQLETSTSGNYTNVCQDV